jgi:Rad3-related DNA helicase
VAVVLDSRLATSTYGQLFVESLPRCRLISDRIDRIEQEVSRFLDD